MYKFALVFPPHLSALDALILWGGTMLALGAKIAGYRAILAKDVHAFRKAHTAWHLASARSRTPLPHTARVVPAAHFESPPPQLLPFAAASYNLLRWNGCTTCRA